MFDSTKQYDCEVIICMVDRDGCECGVATSGLYFGTHAECCQFLRTHKVRRRRGDRNKYTLAIRYTKCGRLASYVL